ncbi:MAG: glycosyltransferase family 4 protein [Syntrophotaleaceae bacterium]
MKVLFIIGRVGIGGHARSALSIGRALAAKGVQVHVAAGEGKGISLLEKSGLPYTIFPTGYEKGYVINLQSFRSFSRINKTFSPDVFHAFDSNALILGYRHAKKNSKKLVYTICGGPVPRKSIPVMRPLVVFSNELKQGLMEKGFPEENISVHAGRIEFENKKYTEKYLVDFLNQLKIPKDDRIVLMVSRIATSKIPALLNFVKAADYVGAGHSVKFLIVGSADDSLSLNKLQESIHDVNRSHSQTLITWTDHGSEQASGLLPLASIAVGMGRSAYEAMSVGLPTLVIGNHGFSALACSDTFATLMEKNFSGRDASDRPEDDASPEKAGQVIVDLLNDPGRAEKIGQEGMSWINDHLTAEKGAEFYSNIYKKENDYFILPAQSAVRKLYFRTIGFRILNPVYKLLAPIKFQNYISKKNKEIHNKKTDFTLLTKNIPS